MTEFEFWIMVAIILPFALSLFLSTRTEEQDEAFRKAIKWWDEGDSD